MSPSVSRNIILLGFAIVLIVILQGTDAIDVMQVLTNIGTPSDQRMAEIETQINLQKVKGILVPVGLGIVDPKKLGR